jgi:hypothetical protein
LEILSRCGGPTSIRKVGRRRLISITTKRAQDGRPEPFIYEEATATETVGPASAKLTTVSLSPPRRRTTPHQPRTRRVVHPAGLRRPRKRHSWRHRLRSLNWTALTSLVAASAAAAGVYYTGRSLETTAEQNTVTAQRQIADRFTMAVDQLDRAGDEHLQARLGGIYALERLARDSPPDHPIVVEVLSAFIRTNAARPKATPSSDTPHDDIQARIYPTPDCPKLEIAADMQAALTVLGRRDVSHDRPGQRIDLRRACLNGANLMGYNFTRADFSSSSLAYANFQFATLSRARFINTDLYSAFFTQAKVDHATFANAHLNSVFIAESDFRETLFISATLANSHIQDSQVAGARLNSADLRFATLVDIDLRQVHHDGRTNLSGVVADERTLGIWWRN